VVKMTMTNFLHFENG